MSAAPVVWFEISVKDAPKSVAFYEAMFGWKIKSSPEYNEVEKVGEGIGGGIRPTQGDQPAMTSFYIDVPDLDATLAQVVKLGGRVALPPMMLEEGLWFAFFQDPDGNFIGLSKMKK